MAWKLPKSEIWMSPDPGEVKPLKKGQLGRWMRKMEKSSGSATFATIQQYLKQLNCLLIRVCIDTHLRNWILVLSTGCSICLELGVYPQSSGSDTLCSYVAELLLASGQRMLVLVIVWGWWRWQFWLPELPQFGNGNVIAQRCPLPCSPLPLWDP